MDGMLESNLNKWEVRPPMPSAAFRNISKQISKLHEGISELLPPQQIYVSVATLSYAWKPILVDFRTCLRVFTITSSCF